ncbi:MAG: oligosaccharide flippase family protein [Roseovarius gahaiensis]
MTNSTGRNVAQAGLQSVAGKMGARLIDFGTLLVLAQLLVPEDFGLIALAMTVVLLIEALSEVPLIQPILRATDPTPDYYDTSFTLGVLRACVLAVVMIGAAWPVAAFYGEPRLPPLIVALTLAPVLRSLISPRMAVFARAYNMRPDMMNTLLAKAGAFCVVVIIALLTQSYWAIAAGTITAPLLMSILSYIKAPYRPRLSLARWAEFSDVVGWNSVNQLFAALSFQIDRILLGRTLPTADMGRYALASDLTGIPFQGILFPLGAPLTVALARAETIDQRQRAWAKVLNAALCIMGPVLLGLSLLAVPIVQALLGGTWREMGPILALLALTSLPSVIGHILAPLAIALYRPKLIAQRTMVDLAVKLPLMLIGIAWFGLWGAIAARGLAGLASAGFALTAARQLTELSVRTQVFALRRTIAGLVVFAILAFWLCPTVTTSDTGLLGRGGLGLQTLLAFGVALGGQLATMLVLWQFEKRPHGALEGAVMGWFQRRVG